MAGIPSNIKYKTNTTQIQNGVVTRNTSPTNATNQGAPGSRGINDARVQGAPNSRTPSTGANVTSTTKVNLPTSTTTKTGGGSSSSRASSGGSSSGGGSYYDGGYSGDTYVDNSYYNDIVDQAKRQAAAAEASKQAIVAYIKNQEDRYKQQLKEKKAAAKSAYKDNKALVRQSYDNQVKSLKNSYNNTNKTLQNNYNKSANEINRDAEESLRQAYINRMLSEKNLQTQMAAMGINGGASETSLAGLLNNYGNARNNINTTLNKNLTDLASVRDQNLAEAYQALVDAKNSAYQNKVNRLADLKNALSNNEISYLSDYDNLINRDNQNYVDLLKSIVANSMNYNYLPTEVLNDVFSLDYSQPTTSSFGSANPNYQAAQNLANSGFGSANNYTQTLANNAATGNNYLANILAQLRG